MKRVNCAAHAERRIVVVRLKPAKCFWYRRRFTYLVAYNYAAGRKERYDAFVIGASGAVRIACECDLPFIRELIEKHETLTPKRDFE